jgi:hypothetical protein
VRNNADEPTRPAGPSQKSTCALARIHEIRTFLCPANRGKTRSISHTPTEWRGVGRAETRIFVPIGTYPKFGDIFRPIKAWRSKNVRKRPKIEIAATVRPNQSHSLGTNFGDCRLNNYQRVFRIWYRNLMDFLSIVKF